MRWVGRVHLRDRQIRAAGLSDVVIGSVVRVGRAVRTADVAKPVPREQECPGGVGKCVRERRTVGRSADIGAGHVNDEAAARSRREVAGRGVPAAVGVRPRVEGPVAEGRQHLVPGDRRRRLCEPPPTATRRVGGAGLLPVHAPEAREDVRILRRRGRLKVLDRERDVDVRAAGA